MDADHARALLEQERERLEGIAEEQGEQAERESAPAPEAVRGGESDSPSNVYDRQVAASVAGHAEAELAEVDAALERVEDGSYGRCQECGKEIPDERLELMPATRYCVEHQELAEKRAGVPDDRAAR
ncbi:MAG: TraR/DksA family transcriptional regulator [Egibacteraceae bacterium]